MNIEQKLSTSLNRRDEEPNIELARRIVETNNIKAIEELFEIVNGNNKNLQNDSIKVIYEIGAMNPMLISTYSTYLLKLLESKNNRLQWGAMTALSTITKEKPDLIFAAMPQIISVADKGSVITNDQCVEILIKLCSLKKYCKQAFPSLIKRIEKSPVNQLPMYAESTMAIIDETNKLPFITLLQKRLPEIEKESKRKRIEKLIKKLQTK